MVEVLCGVGQRSEYFVNVLSAFSSPIPSGYREGKIVDIFGPVTELCNVCNVLFDGVNGYVLAVLILADLYTSTETGPVYFATRFLDSVVLLVAAPEHEPGWCELKSSPYKIFGDLHHFCTLIHITAVFLEDLPCFCIRNLNAWAHQDLHGGVVYRLEFI